MKNISAATTHAELAAIITNAMSAKGLSAILVGGAVVSIYTENKYESYDLDFVCDGSKDEIDSVMSDLGFTRQGKDFVHPATKLFIEFPARTVSIGEASNVKPKGKIRVGETIVILYSPTQCVMDRLAAFFHWNDTGGLEQAVLVAVAQRINLREIKAWAENEGELEKFERFRTKLEQRRHNR